MNNIIMETLPRAIWDEAIAYEEYRKISTALLEEGKTSGTLSENPGVRESPELLEYTRLNEKRMNRLEKTFKPDEEAKTILKEIQTPLLWLTITESWCGDAAQILPVLENLSKLVPGVEHRLVFRDQHIELIDAFRTDGGRSIPKTLFVNPEDWGILGAWGPRPAGAHAMVMEMKAKQDEFTTSEEKKTAYMETVERVHAWYARDKTVHTQREFVHSLAQSLSPKVAH